ncbi:unnamed protein product [Cylicostephanus goldi]|uniref:Glycosyltransferase family 92 protein n=1 Tax=Cylicostephanus goldi TaxID=71465 RepID=A0A3P6TKB9_CYLGO|nr:unnamed protein product [Cylicostephanus goldi]
MTVTKDAQGAIEQPVQLTDRRHDTPIHYLSLCLSPIYGSERKYLVLVELFEHLKLQGVEYFYIYVRELDDYSQMLLEDYIREGQAEVTSLSIRHEFIFCPQIVAATVRPISLYGALMQARNGYTRNQGISGLLAQESSPF